MEALVICWQQGPSGWCAWVVCTVGVEQVVNDAWFGLGMPWVQLVVMAAWTVVMFVVAARTFRWEV